MTILQSLARRYERLAEAGVLSEPGLSPVAIGFEVVLDADGTLRRLAPLDRETPVAVPSVQRTSGIRPATLWDKTAYLLGVTRIEEGLGDEKSVRFGPGRRTAREHAAFVAHHRTLISDSDDEGLRAVMRFLDAWTWERFESEGHDTDLVDRNGVFRLEGDVDAAGRRRFVYERPAARALWARRPGRGEDDTSAIAMCLVSGERGPIARVHPKIRGVLGAQSAGGSIVSFNEPAFDSHGWKQGANAPVSELATHAYTTALNALLAKGSGRSARVGETSVAFWVERLDDASPAVEETLLGEALGAEIEAPELWIDDADEKACIDGETEAKSADVATLRDIVVRLGNGLPVETRLGELDPRTRIHLLGLSPNNARLAVRYWHVGTLGALAVNIARHWRELALEPDPFSGKPPAPWQLLRETAQHVLDERSGRWKVPAGAEAPPRLAGELLAAILDGTAYPGALTSALLRRVRAERGQVTPRRAALLKAIYNRNVARGREEDVLSMALDPTRDEPAYLLGRLFALYEQAEDAASGGRTASIRDRYFASASAMPERVFGTLGISYGHDLAKLRKGMGPGLAVTIDKGVTEVIGRLPADIPRALASENQAQFIVGYYHQKQQRYLSGKRSEADESEKREDP